MECMKRNNVLVRAEVEGTAPNRDVAQYSPLRHFVKRQQVGFKRSIDTSLLLKRLLQTNKLCMALCMEAATVLDLQEQTIARWFSARSDRILSSICFVASWFAILVVFRR